MTTNYLCKNKGYSQSIRSFAIASTVGLLTSLIAEPQANAANFRSIASWTDNIDAITFAGTPNPTGKEGVMTKVGYDLAWLFSSNPQTDLLNATNASFRSSESLLPVHNGKVLIDAVASEHTNALLNDLQKLGLQDGSTFGRYVSGLLPIESIGEMANLKSLKFARPAAYAFTDLGLVTSQGDVAMRADVARSQFGVDGTGVKVGILSDSFNNLGGAAADIANGDLPSEGVEVLEDLPSGGIDEGRALAQLIHDIAPGADLAFQTVFPVEFNFASQARFANGIMALADAGANVIVDDIFNLAEPMFQDGIIAQAVDQVVDNGAAYFTSAGNRGRTSYEKGFNSSAISSSQFGEFHDFDPGEGVDILQSITLPSNTVSGISFQWDEPFFSVSGGAGSSNDLDIFLLDSTGSTILASSTFSNIGQDPLEQFVFFNDGSFGTDEFNLAISKSAGSAPELMKYMIFGFQSAINEYETNSGTVFGHKNAAKAGVVGAAFYQETPEFGQNPPLLEFFSSAGPTPILFDTAGNRLAEPEIRLKPDFVAPDGTNTTFFVSGPDIEGDGLPNFFGTSASVAHAAGVAALMLEAAPGTRPEAIYTTLQDTAIEMNSPGFDFDSGYGLIQADRAVGALVEPETVPEPASALGLLAVGFLGAGLRFKQKHDSQLNS
ncbi:S8 family serine peptidase [Lyngbya aestuarii]|uniref:S8 family serine peptidase n=1 Tax=Lyngbya aestuarii TaxID=118322 RepID=UPI00403D5C22